MAMLLGFVLFGAVLGPLFGTINFGSALLFALIALIVVRPAAMGVAFLRAKMSRLARLFIAWFGPRGLSALLLALLVVEAGAPRASTLLAITGVVVLVSVFAHGVSATPASRWYGERVAKAQTTLAEEREGNAAGLFRGEASDIPRVTPEELRAWLDGPRPPLVLDVRTRAHYAEADGQIPGSVRVLPDQVKEWAGRLTATMRDRPIVAYCT
jgi:NhaP-type Na+/H+ or K+/H+ antiporter